MEDMVYFFANPVLPDRVCSKKYETVSQCSRCSVMTCDIVDEEVAIDLIVAQGLLPVRELVLVGRANEDAEKVIGGAFASVDTLSFVLNHYRSHESSTCMMITSLETRISFLNQKHNSLGKPFHAQEV